MNYPEVDRLVNRYRDLTACRNDIDRAYELLVRTFRDGGMVLAAGNGANGFTAEQFVTGLLRDVERPRGVPADLQQKLEADYGKAGSELAAKLHGALPAVALTGPAGLLSGIADDAGGEMIFAQQVYAYGRSGDTLLILDSGGPNANLLAALRVAGSLGLKRIVLAGREADQLAAHAECTVRVPRVNTTFIQELHLPVCNALNVMLEQEFFS